MNNECSFNANKNKKESQKNLKQPNNKLIAINRYLR